MEFMAIKALKKSSVPVPTNISASIFAIWTHVAHVVLPSHRWGGAGGFDWTTLYMQLNKGVF